ncbi:hypothetical protein Fmac_004386 [Flemingia macrophylla]|uniref:Uncharacterized protein n=1 Tax=Flemingia macrophylla TaxID=520843 RepID=A0ABD1N4W3_9FABA
MAYQNYNHVWRYPSESEEYQVEDPPIEVRPRHHSHRHHNKGRVAFRNNYEYEAPIAEQVETNFESTTRFNANHNAYKSVDQEADAFIEHEHERMKLARLMSTRGA